MLALQAGDSSAFEVLVQRWEKRLLDHCYHKVNDIALAEDLRQEVFLRIYQSAEKYCPTAKFSTWVYHIATNLCLNILAKKGYQAEIPMGIYLASEFDSLDTNLIDASSQPEAVILKKERESQVRFAIASLPEDLRTVVTLRYDHNLKFQEIAKILRCPVSTAHSRMKVGMQRLKQILARQGVSLG